MTAPPPDDDGPGDITPAKDDLPVTIAIDKPDTSKPGKRRRVVQKAPFSPFKKTILLVLVCSLLYSLCGFFLAPILITTLVSSSLAEKMGRPVTIGSARVNPFRFDIILKNGIIGAEKNNPQDKVDPLFSFGRLKIKLQPMAVFSQKPVFQAIHANSVFLHIVRDKNQSLNLPPFITQTVAELGTKSLIAKLKQVDLKLSDAKILFDDKRSATNHVISQISFRLPAGDDNTLSPHFSASINGSPIEFGEVSQQTTSGKQTFVLNLQDIDLTSYLNYLPAPFPSLISKGKADLDLTLSSSFNDSQFNIDIAGSGIARDIWINDGKENHNKIDSATFSFSGNLIDKKITLHKIVLEKPELHINRDKDGTFFFPAKASFNNKQPDGNLQIETMLIKNGKLTFIDQNVPGGFGASFNDVNLKISKNNNNTSSYALNCITNRKTRIASQGILTPDSWKIKGLFILNGLPLPALNSYLSKPGEISIISGVVDKFETSFSLTPQQDNKLSDLSATTLSIQNLGLSFQDKELVTIPLTKLAKGSYSNEKSIVTLGEIDIQGGRFNLSPNTPFPLPTYHQGKNQTLWKINKLRLNNGTVHLRGFPLLTKPQPIFIKDLSATNISSDPKATAQIKTTLSLFKTATLKATGPVKFNPFSGVLDTTIADVSLTNIPDPLTHWLKPPFLSGLLSAEGELTFPHLGFKGNSTIKGLRLRFSDQHELLTIKDMQLIDGSYTLSPLQVKIPQVNIAGAQTGITLTKEKLFNQADFFHSQTEPGKQQLVAINKITVTQSHVTLKDHTTMPPFAFAIGQIKGSIGPIYSQGTQPTTFSFTGKGNNQSHFNLTGTRTLFNPEFKADLTITIKDFPLTAIKPFVEPIAGYGIQGGLFDLVIKYHEKNGTMSGDTDIDIRHLTLTDEDKGNPQFPDIVALLTDSDHHIRLQIPLTVNTTDPSYTLQSAYVKKLRELTLATMVSPYSALGDYFTNQQEPPSQVIFLPGTSELVPQQEDILLSLQGIIQNRPLLHITLAGYSGSTEDRETLLKKKRRQKEKKAREQAIATGSNVAQSYGLELIDTPRKQGPAVLPPKTIRLTKQELQDLGMERCEKIKAMLINNYGIPGNILHIDTTPTVLPRSDTDTKGHRVEFILSGSTP